ADESQRLGHRHIGTEHLLLGILREEESPPAQILYDHGLRLDTVCQAISHSLETAQEQRNSATDHLQSSETIHNDLSFVFQTQFNRLVELLVTKGVIGEDE